MFKRGVDLVLALLSLPVVLPIVAIAALLIKINSSGPAFFSQPRMGRCFRPFRLYKLRTMHVQRPGTAITLGADPRITPVGFWLRKLKVDELPQVWNVLRGEMSFVGPRPVIVDLAHEFRPAYEQLLKVRPGLTDPATLRYANEAELLAKVDEPMHYFRTILTPHKIRLSAEYQENANLGTDFFLIVKTGHYLLLSGTRCVVKRLQAEPGHFQTQCTTAPENSVALVTN